MCVCLFLNVHVYVCVCVCDVCERVRLHVHPPLHANMNSCAVIDVYTCPFAHLMIAFFNLQRRKKKDCPREKSKYLLFAIHC